MLDLDGVASSGRGGCCAGSNIVAAVHGDEWLAGSVTDAALNGLEEAADLDVAGGDLYANELVVFLDS